MKKSKIVLLVALFIVAAVGIMVMVDRNREVEIDERVLSEDSIITPLDEIVEIDNKLETVRFDGDYGFEKFLSEGGASSDSEVIEFLTNNISTQLSALEPNDNKFACSAFSATSENGDTLFGRNFDWYNCDAMIVMSKPSTGYESISTVNMSFITASRVASFAMNFSDELKALASLYAPLDGMNEKGFCISVNMIVDASTIDQETEKPDITTTTAIRLLLNKAASVEEAIEILKGYDMHASMGFMVHFAMSDREGNSVVVEYINNEMNVVETPVITNHYLSEGEKYGIGTNQSHDRYAKLMQTLSENEYLDMEDAAKTLESVSKKNYHDGETTEWSIVFNKVTGDVTYYHQEDYTESYKFKLPMTE